MRLKAPKVSVVISTYKRPEMLFECVDSVLDQTFDDFEIIVVDDGSFTAKDALEPLKQRAIDRDVRLVVLEMEENSGYQCVPKNIGIRYAQGAYIAHADDDDLWLPHHLEVLVAEIEKGGADLVYSCWRVKNEGTRGPSDGSEWPFIPFTGLTAKLILFGPITNFIASHTLWSKGAVVGLLGNAPGPWNEDSRRFGDWQLYYNMLMHGLRFRGVDDVTFIYRWHGENLQLTRPPAEDTSTMTPVRGTNVLWNGVEDRPQ